MSRQSVLIFSSSKILIGRGREMYRQRIDEVLFCQTTLLFSSQRSAKNRTRREFQFAAWGRFYRDERTECRRSVRAKRTDWLCHRRCFPTPFEEQNYGKEKIDTFLFVSEILPIIPLIKKIADFDPGALPLGWRREGFAQSQFHFDDLQIRRRNRREKQTEVLTSRFAFSLIGTVKKSIWSFSNGIGCVSEANNSSV